MCIPNANKLLKLPKCFDFFRRRYITSDQCLLNAERYNNHANLQICRFSIYCSSFPMPRRFNFQFLYFIVELCSFVSQCDESGTSTKVRPEKVHILKKTDDSTFFLLILRLFPKRDVTNFLLIHTLFGTTLYVFSRPHLQGVEVKKRVAYR